MDLSARATFPIPGYDGCEAGERGKHQRILSDKPAPSFSEDGGGCLGGQDGTGWGVAGIITWFWIDMVLALKLRFICSLNLVAHNMKNEEKLGAWFGHAKDILEAVEAFYNGVHLSLTDKGASDERIVALALLGRTMGHLKAVTLLVEQDQIVEARIVTRSCFENMFYVGAIVKEGYAFIQEMGLDYIANRISRGKSLLQRTGGGRGVLEKERLCRFLKELKDENSQRKRRNMTPKGLVSKSEIDHAYIYYEQLSADSVHPSLDSLTRYVSVNRGTNEYSLDIDPSVPAKEKIDTISLACAATIGVSAGIGEIFEDHILQGALQKLSAKHDALSSSGVKRTETPNS